MLMKNRLYRLTSGRYVNVYDVMDVTGLTKAGAYKRLAHNRDDDDVFAKAGHMKGRRILKHVWESEPVRVVMGIPINPEYLDGKVSGNSMYDRDGKLLKYGDRVALHKYRTKNRQEWRENTPDIKNKER